MAMKVKKDDTVIVIAGKDKGKKGKVLATVPNESKVVVEGVNMQKKHVKARSAQQPGGIMDKQGAIDSSNVMVVCPKCGKAVRVAYAIDEKTSKKVRVCKKCGEKLEKVKTAKKATAKKTAKKKETSEEASN